MVARTQASIIRELAEEVAKGRGKEEVTVSFSVQTSLGGKRIVDELRVAARMLGVEFSEERAGGWLSASHYIELEGASEDVLPLLQELRRVQRSGGW